MDKKKKQRPKKVTTIDGLARMMQSGFVKVDEKIDLVSKDLGVEIGLVKMDLAEVKRDVKEMKDNSSELFKKLDAFIKLYEETKSEYQSLAKLVARLENRVAQLEKV